MPRNGSGTYTLPQAPFVPGTTISSSAVNSDLSDIASALTGSIAADGQTQITGALKGIGGTLTNPSWTFGGDTSAGMYLPAVGSIGLVADSFGIVASTGGFVAASASVSSGGTGYAVNDTITLTGGTALRNAIFIVASLSGSAVASATIIDNGLYSTTPSNPVAQGSTSGSGTGCTLTVTWSSADYVSNQSGGALWTELGASSYMAGAMVQRDGLRLAEYIGAANIAAAVQTALPLPVPEGYLTPQSNTPIITGDVTNTVLYWTPKNGLWTVIHNGTTLIPIQLAGQLQLTLTASQAALDIYDIFLCYNGGTPVIGTGPSWAAGTGGSVTPGSCARGSGSGSTAISRYLGWYTNTNSMTVIYNTGSGNISLTVAANQGVYLGSIYIDTTPGQVTNQYSWGQNRKWGVFNAFNRSSVFLKTGSLTATYDTSSATLGPYNSDTTARVTTFCGLAEEAVNYTYIQRSGALTSSPNNISCVGYNSTTVGSGIIGVTSLNGLNAWPARYLVPPTLGLNTAYCLVANDPAVGTARFYGGSEANMTLLAEWKA